MLPADIPSVALLEAAAEALKQEALALHAVDFVPMPSKEHYQGNWRGFLLSVGPWEHEYPGVDFAQNRRRCPVASALIQQIPGAKVAGYLWLDPGAVLGDHTDMRDDDVIRVHIGLQLPEEEQAYWPEGRARLLDVRQPHRAENRSQRPRLTFVVDVNVGFPVLSSQIAPWGPPVAP